MGLFVSNLKLLEENKIGKRRRKRYIRIDLYNIALFTN